MGVNPFRRDGGNGSGSGMLACDKAEPLSVEAVLASRSAKNLGANTASLQGDSLQTSGQISVMQGDYLRPPSFLTI